jgi:hypothetical protein
MLAGVRGRLITASFVQSALHALPGAAAAPDHVVHALDLWSLKRESACGPASPVRAIADAVVLPLLRILGFSIERRAHHEQRTVFDAVAAEGAVVPVVVVSWSESLDSAWRFAVLGGVRADARWCFCVNGTALRIVDAQRTWSRAHVEFDLALVARETEARTLLWSVARAEALSLSPPVLDRAVALSADHGALVCRALGRGVLEALGLLFQALCSHRANEADVYQQSLTILYRVLFLLFAEARALVPMWHPVYRDRYSLDAIVSTLLKGRSYRGMWHALVAISRLAHAGCAAGELKVTAFNGRLFSPAHSAAFDRTPIGDEVMSGVIMAVSTTSPRSGGRERIAYRDLDVEQLGAVYEHVLEYQPHGGGLDRTRDIRKSTGTFYTPRAVTAYLVRQTLEPLIRGRSSDDILRLRVLDLAMGSGAFLVGACRYLAGAMEEALVREGRWHPGDVTAADRAALRRDIAQRCLFGADLNPMAVQLARLSLWLVTLAADKPLTFLDHHLVAGDSLVGASPDDVRRQPSRGRQSSRRQQELPLFEHADLAPVLEHAVRTRVGLAATPDDSVAIVRGKEEALATLHARQAPLGRLARVLDLWCAGWFWDNGAAPDAATFGELSDRLLHGRSTLPSRLTDHLLGHADALAERHRFLHWTTAFPEVFCDDHGRLLPDGGFDAIVGNPPWDMVRGDAGDGDVRAGRKDEARRLTDFVREAGIYRVESRAHANRYQLFVERALQLTRPGGRIGLVLPAGSVTDTGAGALRRHLFDRADVDRVTGLDNRGGIFPIHRSARFALVTCTRGRPTTAIACRFGITHTDDLDGFEHRSAPLMLTRRLLARISGEDDLGIPELVTEQDLRIVEGITAKFPWLGSEAGWNVHFGRELNASDDLATFVPFSGSPDGRPVLEGKQIEPFRSFPGRSRYELPADASTRVPRRARLAYRDIASATNRLTLIAAVLPARVVTTHTLFCLKTPLPSASQHVLCALLNSFVANYLIRLRVNTHVTSALVSRLPVPVVDPLDPAFTRLADISRTLARSTGPAEQLPEYAELQARAAHLFAVSTEDFEHILSTFPLIPQEVRTAALTHFTRLHSHGTPRLRGTEA